MTVSVITPVRDGDAAFRACLPRLVAALRPGDESVVVADGPSDGWADWARGLGARVLPSAGRPGPARARNRGAAEARGEILLFIDADVVVPVDLVARVEAELERHPDVAAVIGSYDDSPAAPGVLSRYRNLLHHHVHQHGREEASTFWCGCGAVRRPVFADCGGFDESFDRPSIEDIDLGYRLRRAGHRIRLVKTLQVTHLKAWTARSIVYTDVVLRAIPWGRLTARSRWLGADLNLDHRTRAGVALVGAGGLAALAAAWHPAWLLAALAAGGASVWLHREFYGLLLRRGGWRLAAAGTVWHWVYLACGGLGFAVGFARGAVEAGRSDQR